MRLITYEAAITFSLIPLRPLFIDVPVVRGLHLHPVSSPAAQVRGVGALPYDAFQP
jgi:hypothetical protein